MPKNFKIFFILLMLFNLADSIAGEMIVRGFYYGRNLYVRNPYLSENSEFCVKEVWVNGIKTQGSIRASAFEIELSHLQLNQRVVVRLLFNDGCQPEIANLHVIRDDSKFDIFDITVEYDIMSWATQAERNNSYFVVERERFGKWIVVDTITGKGSYNLNQYNIQVRQYTGQNPYKIHYFDDSSPNIVMTKEYVYESDDDEIEFSYEEDGRLALSKVIDFEVRNYKDEIVLKGEGVHIEVNKLPRGNYKIYVDNVIKEIEKKR